jgi:hypothetical protein
MDTNALAKSIRQAASDYSADHQYRIYGQGQHGYIKAASNDGVLRMQGHLFAHASAGVAAWTSSKRSPVPIEDLLILQWACKETNNDGVFNFTRNALFERLTSYTNHWAEYAIFTRKMMDAVAPIGNDIDLDKKYHAVKIDVGADFIAHQEAQQKILDDLNETLRRKIQYMAVLALISPDLAQRQSWQETIQKLINEELNQVYGTNDLDQYDVRYIDADAAQEDKRVLYVYDPFSEFAHLPSLARSHENEMYGKFPGLGQKDDTVLTFNEITKLIVQNTTTPEMLSEIWSRNLINEYGNGRGLKEYMYQVQDSRSR